MRWFGRLGRSAEIAYVRRSGRRSALAAVTVFSVPARAQRTLVAVTVAKSVGIAVVRNRVRRRILGALDASVRPAVIQPQRIVIVARPAAASLPYGALAADIDHALARVLV